MTKVNLDEPEVLEGTWKSGVQDRLDRFLDDLGAGNTDVGPKVRDNVVKKA